MSSSQSRQVSRQQIAYAKAALLKGECVVEIIFLIYAISSSISVMLGN